MGEYQSHPHIALGSIDTTETNDSLSSATNFMWVYTDSNISIKISTHDKPKTLNTLNLNVRC